MSSYAACHHDEEAPIDATNHGVFFLNSRVTYDDLKDGAAYTLFLGEKRTREAIDLGWLSGTPATLRNVGSPLNELTERTDYMELAPWHVAYSDQFYDDTSAEDFEEAMEASESEPSAEADDAAATDDEAEESPAAEDAEEFLARSLLGGDPEQPLHVGGFGSSHPSGVNFALGDGSVRFIGDTIARQLYQDLSTKAYGEVVTVP